MTWFPKKWALCYHNGYGNASMAMMRITKSNVIFLSQISCLAICANLPEIAHQEAFAMKLVISELNALARYVSREFHDVINHLIQHYGWNHIDTLALFNSAKPLKARLLEAFGKLPETILFWEGYNFLPQRAK